MNKKLHFLQPVWVFAAIISQLMIVSVAAGQDADSSKYCDAQCCIVDHTPVGVMISHIHPKKGWMLSYRYMSMSMKGNLSGTDKVSDDVIYQNYLMSPQSMRMDMHMLMAMYGLSDKITLMAMFNYNVFSMNMSMLPGDDMEHMMNMPMSGTNADMSMNSSGIGDTKLYALYSVYNKSSHHFLLSGGVSVPTGSIQIKGTSDNMYPDKRIPYSMQPGSGSFELLPGITYLRYTHSFSWSVQASSVIRTNYNSVGYKSGNEFTLNTWVAYQWSRWFSSSLRIDATVTGKIEGRDPALYDGMELSANPANYGGRKSTIYGGINFYFRKGVLKNNRLAVEYGIPLYQNLNGIQTATRSTLYAGWQIAF